MAMVETMGSVLWFAMDSLWMLDLAPFAKAMILPTFAVNVLVFRYTKNSFSEFCVVAAMNSWLAMNIFWMIGDLDDHPGSMTVARAMLALGILFLTVAVIRNAAQGRRLTQVLAHFRRLRL